MFSVKQIIKIVTTHLDEHFVEICLGIDPGRHCIAEEDKVGHHAHRIHRNHLTHAPERRVLLLIVPYVAQRSAPDMSWQ